MRHCSLPHEHLGQNHHKSFDGHVVAFIEILKICVAVKQEMNKIISVPRILFSETK